MATNEGWQDTEEISDENSADTEPTIVNDTQYDMFNAEAENVGPRERSKVQRQKKASVLADRVGRKHHDTHEDTKGHVEPTECVVDGIVDHRDDGRRTLY